MLLRRAVTAAGMAVALAGAGAGPALAGTGGGEPAEAGVLASAPLQQQDALVDQQGLCADGSPAGDAGCESESLGNGYLNACVREDAGLVSDIAGGEGGVAQQAGLSCDEASDDDPEPAPPPEDGGDGDEGDDGDNGGGDNGDGDGTTATPPLNRAELAEPAEAIEAEPTFTG